MIIKSKTIRSNRARDGDRNPKHMNCISRRSTKNNKENDRMRQKLHRTGFFGRLVGLTAALLLALAMVPMAAVSATADTTQYSITIKGTPEGHTYAAYQIFSGTVNSTGDTLSDIQWGSGVSSDGQTGLQNLYNVTSAEGVARILAQTTTGPDNAPKDPYVFSQLFATNPSWLGNAETTTSTRNSDGTYTMSVSGGYYLIVDITGDGTTVDAYTRFILNVAGNVEVNRKADVPTVQKKVKDQQSDGTLGPWQDSADYDIGDKVPFKLTAVLPSDYQAYKNNNSYYMQFVDVMDPGFTPDTTSIKMYIGDKTDSSRLNEGNSYPKENYTVAWDEDTHTLTITIDNLTNITDAAAGESVSFEYSATLNENAVIGKTGNANKVSLIYSNNPNINQGGKKGKTPEDKVKVFTYGLKISKVNEKNEALSGASFTLKHKEPGSNSYEEVERLATDDANATFTWTGLDAGEYQLTETAAPDGYNRLTRPIRFTITADHEVTSDDPSLREVKVDGANEYDIIFAWDNSGGDSKNLLSATVKNEKGGTLPSTGGRGTQLFYLVGGILAAGAGLTLIARRRSRRREK